MGLGVDLGVGCRARMKVEPTSGGVRYKKGGNLCPLKYTLLLWCYVDKNPLGMVSVSEPNFQILCILYRGRLVRKSNGTLVSVFESCNECHWSVVVN